jgi:CheY-like chemotaxis protein
MDKLKILWVDDEPDTMVFEVDELQDMGHQVMVKQSLPAAINAIKQQQFDLILLDQQFFQPELPNDPKVSIWMGCILLRAVRKNFTTIKTAPDWVQGMLEELDIDVELKQHPNTTTYVAFISGFSNPEVIYELKNSSAADQTTTVFAKPITEHILMRIITLALKHIHQHQHQE